MKASAQPGSKEDFDFFVTVGDNLYIDNPAHPTDQDFETMMNMYLTRDAIKDLPIHPVRGNHVCYFDDMFVEPRLQDKYPTW